MHACGNGIGEETAKVNDVRVINSSCMKPDFFCIFIKGWEFGELYQEIDSSFSFQGRWGGWVGVFGVILTAVC